MIYNKSHGYNILFLNVMKNNLKKNLVVYIVSSRQLIEVTYWTVFFSKGIFCRTTTVRKLTIAIAMMITGKVI